MVYVITVKLAGMKALNNSVQTVSVAQGKPRLQWGATNGRYVETLPL